jgi:hypothetical protein
VLEAENGQGLSGPTHTWLTATAINGYTGTAYLQVLPDIDTFYQTDAITDSPKIEYLVNFTTPETYTIWVRGYADNADADAVNVSLNETVIDVTGFAPEVWDWANQSASGGPAKVVVETSGVYTLSLLMREDGMRVDRLLLTTNTTYIPSDFGPAESEQQRTSGGPIVLVDRTIVYTYDNLYRLTDAAYSTGDLYEYDYDPVSNRL